MKKIIPFVLVIYLLSFTPKSQADRTPPCSGWEEIEAFMKNADSTTHLKEVTKQFGRPLHQERCPSLKEEYIVYFRIYDEPETGFWLMFDSRTKKYLYWSNQPYKLTSKYT